MADEPKDETPKPPSRIKRRLIRTAVEIAESDADRLVFMHSVLCQTSLPYRDPGAVRFWKQRQGDVRLLVEAGRTFDPNVDDFVEIGLPFGPKPRLILAHLNAEALRTRSPVVEVGDSLTAFVGRIGLDRKGQNIRNVRNQLGRLAAATIRLAIRLDETHARQINARVVEGVEVWAPRDARQRVLWPSCVTLDPHYFVSLMRHAVPLDERAIGALSHSAMALDMYAWLAQRLHRVDPFRPQSIPWTGLQAQFGLGYGRMNNFKRAFREVLATVHTQYRAARVELDDRGMTLRCSPTPVKGRPGVVNSFHQPLC